MVVDWPHRYLRAEHEAGPDRPAHRGHGADPRPEVRRTPARGGAAPARGRVRRRHGLAAYPRRPAGPAPRGRADRGRAGPAVQPDRARPRRPHPRGDRDQHRRRDHRRPLGRQRASGWPSPTAGSTARRTRWADEPYTGHAPDRAALVLLRCWRPAARRRRTSPRPRPSSTPTERSTGSTTEPPSPARSPPPTPGRGGSSRRSTTRSRCRR